MKHTYGVLTAAVCAACVFLLPIMASATQPAGAPEGLQAGTRLVVSNSTPVSGHFGTLFFGDNTSDLDIRMLLHDYGIVEWEETSSEASHVTAVRELKTETQVDGSHIYTVTLSEGLCYNDGSAITARDYVFSLLLAAAPALREAGGTNGLVEHIRGYKPYESGDSLTLSGVRMLSDLQFSIQVQSDAPHYFILSQVAIPPYPIAEIAPGCAVADDGDGAYLTKSENAAGMRADGYTPGEFSARMLSVTLLDPDTGYEFYPRVTSGPYQLETYSPDTQTVTLVANPYFAGNGISASPHIERLELRAVEADRMLDALSGGEVDLLNKVASHDAIAAAQRLAVEGAGAYASSTYLRAGLAMLSFSCEQGPAASVNVRRAIAMCFDKDALTQALMGGLARRVYGYYGMGQWMASYAETPTAAEGQNSLRLSALDVPMDIEGAKRLLEADGWNLGPDGGPYQTGIRYRQEAQGLKPLILRLAVPEENTATDKLKTALEDGLDAIGAELQMTKLPFGELLSFYYRQQERTYDMFFLTTNFKYPFDPYFDFHTGEEYQGDANKTGILDDSLMEAAHTMRNLDHADAQRYVDTWLSFQERLAALQPIIPLYSGVYIDVYTARLQNYDIQNHSGWARAIQAAWLLE